MPLNLGDIQFALGADTSGLDRAVQKLVDFSAKVDQASKRQSDAGIAVAEAYKKQEAAITSALTKVANLQATIKRAGVGNTAQMTSAAAAAFDKYTNSMTRSTVSALAFQRANANLALNLGGIQRQLAGARTSGGLDPNSNLANMAARMRDLAGVAVILTGPLGGVASRITALTSIISRDTVVMAGFVAGAGLMALALEKISKSALNAGKEVDSVKETLSVISGVSGNAGATIGNQSYKDLFQVANQSGYRVQDLAEQWENFAQVTKDTALAGQRGEQVFTELAVVMGNLHRSPDQVSSALRTMQQMLDNNTVSAMQLKRQLGNDLPGAFQEAQKAMGFTGVNGTANFTNALKKNLIQPDVLLPKMMEQYAKDLGDATAQVDTFEAAQNRLHNANLNFFNDMDKALGITTGAKSAYNEFAKVVTALDNALEHAGPAIKGVVSGLITFASVGGTLLAVSKAASIASAAFEALGVSFGGLALLSPPGWVVGIVATLVAATAAIYSYLHASSAVEDSTVATTKATNEYLASLKKIGGANTALFAGNAQWNAQKQAVEDAKKALADYEAQQEKLGAQRAAAGLPLLIDDAALAKWHKLKQELADAQKALNDLQNAMTAHGTSKPFGINDDQAKKFEQTRQRLMEMNDELTKGSAALSGPNGLEAYKKLNEQFADNKKVLAYAQSLNTLPPAYQKGLMSVQQYRIALQQLTEAQDKARLDEEAIKGLQTSVAGSFNILGDAIKQLATTGKLNFQSLASAAGNAAASIVNEFMKLAVLNPLMNMIFGYTGTSAQLPVIGGIGNAAGAGAGAGIFSFLGLSGGGFAPGGFNNPVNAAGDSIAAPGFAKGGAWSNGIRFLADGGILNSPTLFGTSSGLAIGGEAGSEAVMPLVRGPGGKLGVANHGGSNVVVNISTPNIQSFQHPASQAQVATGIRKAIMQAQRNM